MSWKRGGCHCGAVTFEVLAPDQIEVLECNCSMCSKSGYQHLIVAKDRFRLLSGEDKLITYTFSTGTAQHRFCSVCGVKSFYVPRSHPDGYSVNAHCLADGSVRVTRAGLFDGAHWEDAMAKHSHEA
ncbi:MAG: GFA family protein [Methyloceanibacter sp.]